MAPFRSAFDGYRRFEAGEPIADWRRSNDTMRLLGGHAGHVSAPAPADAGAAQGGKRAASQPAADPRK